MKKLTLLAASVTAAGISASAAAATITPPEVFVGAQVGYQDTSLEAGSTSTTSFGSSKTSTETSISGVAGNVFAGMKFDVGNSVFLAPEVNVGTSGAESTTESSSTSGSFQSSETVKAEAGTSYGVGLLAGVDISSGTSLYGRLGYQRTSYELSVSSSAYDMASSASASASGSDSKTFDGFRYGFGVSTDLSPDFSVRADWSQTRYSSEGASDGDGNSVSFEPTESLFQLGVAYRF